MQAEIEKQDYGADFVNAAVRVAQTIDGFEERGEILTRAANIYAEAGHIDLAVNLADTIDDSYQRDQALTRIAAICAADDDEQAESLLEMIDDEGAYGLAIEQIATAYARSGEIEKALDVAQRLSDPASALSNIALACPPAALLTDGLDIARSIDYPEVKSTTLVELAARAASLGEETELAEIIQEADQATDMIDLPLQRIVTRVAIAAWYKDHNQPEQAAEALNKARQDGKETEKHERDLAVEQIAVACAELKDFPSADQLLETIEDPFQFAHASAAVALPHHEAGDNAAALKLVADGLEVVKDERIYGQETLIRREAALERLALSYATIERVEDALQVMEMLGSDEERDSALRQIAIVATATDDSSVAFKIFEKIKDDSLRVLCQVDVVRAWTNKNQLALADHVLGNASAEVAKIERPFQRSACLAELAQVYELREQPSRASENLLEALRTAATITGNYLQARALLGLAAKHRELSRPSGEAEQQILESIIDRLD